MNSRDESQNIRKYDMKEVYPVPAEFEKTARTNEQEYFKRYQKSIEQPDEYWAEQALKLDWIKPFSQVKNTRLNLSIISNSKISCDIICKSSSNNIGSATSKINIFIQNK